MTELFNPQWRPIDHNGKGWNAYRDQHLGNLELSAQDAIAYLQHELQEDLVSGMLGQHEYRLVKLSG